MITSMLKDRCIQLVVLLFSKIKLLIFKQLKISWLISPIFLILTSEIYALIADSTFQMYRSDQSYCYEILNNARYTYNQAMHHKPQKIQTSFFIKHTHSGVKCIS